MGEFILDDFSRDPIDGKLLNKKTFGVTGPGNPWLGHAIIAPPFEAHTVIDFTGPLGSSSGLYYSLMFQLGKWEFKVKKADEWIEVSPIHSQYYQLTHKQKEELESRIKQGLASAAQAVADLELLLHDMRKYQEFLDYFGQEYNTEKREFKLVKEKRDNHSLRSMFIDLVDAHTGEGISMRSIVSRWPTLIVDFMKLDDTDIDTSKLKDKLDISKAEAVVLVTKNKLYVEWKKLFEPQLLMRYKRIKELAKSREHSLEEYRNWLKPYIARHKLIEEGLSRPNVRKTQRTSFIPALGQAVSSSVIEIWTWRDIISPEFFKGGSEALAKKPVDPADSWTMKNIIFHKDHGLVVKHPWITPAWVKQKKDEVFGKEQLLKIQPYYSFFVINLSRTNIRTATGNEIEDGMFDVNAIFMSQNVVFCKILDLKAKEEEFDRYVDDLIGISKEPKKLTPKEEKQLNAKSRWDPMKDFFDKFSLGMDFIKPGPYEHNFNDRITKYYLQPMARDRYGPIVGFIKKKIGFGTS